MKGVAPYDWWFEGDVEEPEWYWTVGDDIAS